MASDRHQGNNMPSRPRAVGYGMPTFNDELDPANGISNPRRSAPTKLQRMLSRDNVPGRSRLTLKSLRTVSNSTKPTRSSRKSTVPDAGRSLSLPLDARTALSKTKPVLEAAAAAGMRAAKLTTSKLNRFVANVAKIDEAKTKGDVSRSSSSSSKKSLYNMRRLPKLKIPDLKHAVEDALNSACSTDTTKSENFRLLELSPTSRHLKDEMMSDHPDDVVAEFHNMLSARRRVRKGKFGAVVSRYRLARPTWDSSWATRNANDNEEDRELMRVLVDAVQEQKDEATRLVQRNPNAYPGLQPVSKPGCTLSLYWQHKSSYK